MPVSLALMAIVDYFRCFADAMILLRLFSPLLHIYIFHFDAYCRCAMPAISHFADATLRHCHAAALLSPLRQPSAIASRHFLSLICSADEAAD